MKMTRTYRLVAGGGAYLPGLREEDDDVEVFDFSSAPVRFRAEGGTPTDDFLVAKRTWEKMGKPERITVTVEPVSALASV